MPETLYSLAASTAEIEKQQKDAAHNPRQTYSYFPSNRRDEDSPGRKVAELPLMQYINQWFSYNGQFINE